MFTVIGFIIVFGSVLAGFTMHGGNVMVLVQITEFFITAERASGRWSSATPSVVKRMISDTLAPFRPDPTTGTCTRSSSRSSTRPSTPPRRPRGHESHVEEPESSSIFRKYPSFHSNQRAMYFLSDTMKVL